MKFYLYKKQNEKSFSHSVEGHKKHAVPLPGWGWGEGGVRFGLAHFPFFKPTSP